MTGARPGSRRPAARPRAAARRTGEPGDRGASSVELVITMPALLLAVLVIMQFGIWAHAQHVALAAARDGAEAARAYGASEAAGHDRATTSLDRLGPTILRDPHIEVTRTAQEVTVTVTAHAPSILGGLFTFGVREQAHGPVERFIPTAGETTP